jgi:hypothetical protein
VIEEAFFSLKKSDRERSIDFSPFFIEIDVAIWWQKRWLVADFFGIALMSLFLLSTSLLHFLYIKQRDLMEVFSLVSMKIIRPICPECGGLLSVHIDKDEKTGEIQIEFFCEGPGDDEFDFEILTGLTDNDLKKLKQKGKIIRKEMKIRLFSRKPDKYFIR